MARTAAFLAVVVAAAIFGAPALAAPGALDPTFAAGGVSTLQPGGHEGQALAVAQQPDGKLVVAAAIDIAENLSYFDSSVAVLRYLPDGTLDPSFGSGGVAYPSAARGGWAALALSPNGKIVLARGVGADPTTDISVQRLNADGSLDTGFGTGGQFLWDSGSPDQLVAVAVQPDGRIVVLGTAGPGTFVLRIGVGGSLDPTFGSGGVAGAHGSGVAAFTGYALALQPDGKIVVGGQGGHEGMRPGLDEPPPVVPENAALMRLNADGSLDGTFGSYTIPLCDCILHGFVFTYAGTDGVVNSLALQSDGAIVAGGAATTACVDSGFVLRYDTWGNLDQSFGTDGQAPLASPQPSGYPVAEAVQPDGRIVVVGVAHSGFADPTLGCVLADEKVLVQRLNADGTADTSFGTGGVVATPVGQFAVAFDGLLQADGKIVAAGFSDDASTALTSVTLVRYLGDEPATQLAGLRAAVDGAALARPLQAALDVKLRTTACGPLGAFANEVSAQAGKGIPARLAVSWLARDAELRAALGCRV